MAATTAEIDSQYALDWTKWPVPEQPAIPDWQGPWNIRVDQRAVDTERTARLAKHDLVVRTVAGNVPWEGSSYGMPINLFNVKGPKTPVWDMSQPVTWNWFTPTFPIHQVALPNHVRREGDPAGGSDRHAYFVDTLNGVMIETVLAQKSPLNRLQTWFQADWTVGYSGGGRGIVQWDTKKTYDAPGQPRGGVVAAQVPQLPMVARWDEIQKGRITHALFGVLPNYSSERWVGWARGTDGLLKDHPVRAGDILRLKKEKLKDFTPGTPAHIIATALNEYGFFLGDKTGDGSGAGFPLTQDRRWQTGEGSIAPLGVFQVQLTDFELVKV